MLTSMLKRRNKISSNCFKFSVKINLKSTQTKFPFLEFLELIDKIIQKNSNRITIEIEEQKEYLLQFL